MSADRDAIERLLASISDGASADWDQELLESPAAQRTQVAALRDIASIAAFNRGLQRGPDPFASSPQGTAAAPKQWGHLTLLDRLGVGAQAEVHRAWDAVLQREVALKLDLSAPGGAQDVLLREGRAAARIKHPNVVTVHGIDRHEGVVGMWMELVRGDSLERIVSGRSPLAIAEAVRLARELAAALVAVHEAGLLHADLKPANVVRDADGRFVLTDFGLGHRPWAQAGDPTLSGTPMYMAPERFASAPASERSDLYSWGMVLWFALSGRHAFSATSLPGLIEDAKRGPSARLASLRPDAPPALVAIIERAIAPSAEARFASARELAAALEEIPASAVPPAATPKRMPRAQLVLISVVTSVLAVVVQRYVGRALNPAHPSAQPTPATAPVAPSVAYTVDASFFKRTADAATPLANGDRVRPGDRLSLQIRASQASHVYVLNEDEQGERYLLFPQPRFDTRNPLPADSNVTLPGRIGTAEQAWTVTSAGGREHFLVVVSPEPVAELEAELATLAPASPGRPIEYARVSRGAVELLRGVGGVAPLPATTPATPRRSGAFAEFKALAGREHAVQGTWVRQFVLENPDR